MPPKRPRTTLATVAASANVSVATVSKVLNGRTDVSATTRALIERLLEQHQYVVRRAEPAGRNVTDPVVELVLPGLLTAYATEVLQGVLDVGPDLHVTVAVSGQARAQREASRPGAWARRLTGTGRRAVITVANELTAEELAELVHARMPLVVVDPLGVPGTGVTSVGSTNFAGGRNATRHLLSLGHRRIAYVGGPGTAECNQARIHGYRAEMEAAGAPILPEYVRMGRFRYEDGVDGGAALLGLAHPPTAVFAGNDEIAAGILEAARTRGLRVPEDLSVVGFDDTEVARRSSPPLTTVRQPLREMGGVALRTAMRLAAGEKLESHHVELATELVVRRSTCSPPRA